ncbi:MAG: type transport system permease protein [Solirubrobacterales bacterium]|jgi:ABC-2 type transport system permease protein|nr:type transport system permease protein [Solirubrobacterales bacterium]
MRWLLLKDLQILRRSPLIVGLLIAYPVVLGVLIGFALSADNSKPRVAFLNEVPADQQFQVGSGGDQVDRDLARDELCSRVTCVDVSSREEAIAKVENGDVIAALILPPDLLDKLNSLATLNPQQPQVEVLVNQDDPLKASLVDDRIQALITEANLILAQRISDEAARYLDLLVKGGQFSLPLLGTVDILGLNKAAAILEAVGTKLPPDSPAQDALDRVTKFAGLAGDNLHFALPLLGAISQPITVDKQVVAGTTSELDTFAIAVAATVTLMFVTVLLVAGSLALEREENAYARVTRGLVGPGGLLSEKIVLGIVASFAVTLLLLGALTALVSIDWGRTPLILLAILGGGAGFAAFGAAIGGSAKEVRASSLLAFMVSLPIAFLSLVPSGTVNAGVFHVIEAVRALCPFDPALDAMQGALDSAGPDLAIALIHLAAIAAAYGFLARLALRRFSA